jgi:hypothetical protein
MDHPQYVMMGDLGDDSGETEGDID